MIALFCALLEMGTRYIIPRASRIEARVAADHKAASRITAAEPGSVLLVGNSLLLQGIDCQALQEAFGTGIHFVCFPIEQTQYLDWYYGMRRLFAEGAKPKMVILCMNTAGLLSAETRADYSSYYLFKFEDLRSVARESRYDLTKLSGLALSHFSFFYADRLNIRNFVVHSVDPAYAEALHNVAVRPPMLPSEKEMETRAARRLRALTMLCSAHGARFMFLLPPGFGSETAIVRAEAASATPVVIPIHLNELPETEFSDGFHLNAHGRKIFTGRTYRALFPYLRCMMLQKTPLDPRQVHPSHTGPH